MRFSDSKGREWAIGFTCRQVRMLDRELGLKSLDFAGQPMWTRPGPYTFAGNVADRVVLLGQQHGDLAVAGLAHARKQFLLLEAEVPVDVLLQAARQRHHQLDQVRLTRPIAARRARQGLLGAAQQVEIGTMFLVQGMAGLSGKVHGRIITVSEYQIS